MSYDEREEFLIENGLSEADVMFDDFGREFVELTDEEGVKYKQYI